MENNNISIYKYSKKRKGGSVSLFEIKMSHENICTFCKSRWLGDLKKKYKHKVGFIVEPPTEDSKDERWTFMVKSKNYQILKSISQDIVERYTKMITISKIIGISHGKS